MENKFYNKDVANIERILETDATNGLTLKQAHKRLRRWRKSSIYPCFSPAKQEPLKNILYGFSFILLFVFSVLMYNFSDKRLAITSIVMLAVFFLFTLFTYIMSGKVIARAVTHSVAKIKVIRQGKRMVLEPDSLVRGDLVLLTAGDVVPADSVIVSGHVYVYEGKITGYRGPQRKLPSDGRSEQNNIIYASSIIKNGECTALVVGVGNECEIVKKGGTSEKKELSGLYSLRSINVFSSIIGTIGFVISLIMILLAFLHKFSPTELLESTFTVIAFSAGMLTEFSFVVIYAIIAFRFSLSNKKGKGEAVAIITEPISIDKLSETDCIIMDTKAFFDENDVEIVALENSNYVFEASDRITESAKLFLRCVAVAESKHRLNPFIKAKEKNEITTPYAEALCKYAGQKAGESRFQLGYKLPECENKFNVSVLLGRSMFSVVSGKFEDILDACDSVIIDNRAQPLDFTRKSELVTKASYFIENGYDLIAYAQTVYSEEDIKNGSFTFSHMQFFGFIVYKSRIREDADRFFEMCRDNEIRPVLLSDNAKYMIRELKIKCPTLDDTHLCSGIKFEDDKSFAEAVEDYDFFLGLDAAKTEILTETLKKNGYNVSYYCSGFSDFEYSQKADTIISSLDTYDYKHPNRYGEFEEEEITPKIKSGAISENSDAQIDSGVIGVMDIIDVSRKLYMRMELVLKYLIASYTTRAVLLLIFFMFGIQALTSVQMLMLNFYVDLMGIICIASAPCKNAYKRQKTDFSVNFYRDILFSQIPSYIFAVIIFALSAIIHFAKLDATISSLVFTSLFMLSPVALLTLHRDLWTKYTLAYFAVGVVFIMLAGAIPVMREVFGIGNFGKSLALCAIPLMGYIGSLIFCIYRKGRAKSHKKEKK